MSITNPFKWEGSSHLQRTPLRDGVRFTINKVDIAAAQLVIYPQITPIFTMRSKHVAMHCSTYTYGSYPHKYEAAVTHVDISVMFTYPADVMRLRVLGTREPTMEKTLHVTTHAATYIGGTSSLLAKVTQWRIVKYPHVPYYKLRNGSVYTTS